MSVADDIARCRAALAELERAYSASDGRGQMSGLDLANIRGAFDRFKAADDALKRAARRRRR